MSKRVQLEPGTRFGRLSVVAYAGSLKNKATWLCRCDCGSTKTCRSNDLRRGKIVSCGCQQPQNRKASIRAHTTHGMTNSPEFSSWKSLKERCTNETSKDYPRYGGRGIKVCDRWQTFENFYADMGPRPSPKHTIDRKDNNGHYEPSNCRWATPEVQGNNKRNNVRLSLGGRSKTVAQWSREIGIPYDVIHHRLKSGWSVDATLTKPVRPRSPNVMGTKS